MKSWLLPWALAYIIFDVNIVKYELVLLLTRDT